MVSQMNWAFRVRPKSWGEKRAVPLHKAGDTTCYDAYRILAVGEALGQWYEEVWLRRVRHKVGPQLDPAQVGHRFCTLIHVIALLETINHRMQSGAETAVALVDFRKFYDTVPRSIMLRAVKELGATDEEVCVLRSIFSPDT